MTRPDSPDLDALIDRLLITRAGAGYDRMRGQALAELLAAGEPGHAAVVERLESSDNPRPLIRILPMFGLEETVPVLAAVLQRPDADSVLLAAAADALAAHPSPAADDALVEAAASGSRHVAEAARAAMADRLEPGGPID